MFNLFGGSKRPNTQIPFTLYKQHAQPMPPCPLKPDAWEKALEKYSDKTYTKSLVGMLRYGALIGYTRPRAGQTLHRNHGSAREQPELLEQDLREQLRNKRLTCYKEGHLPPFFVSSPIGLVDKNDGNKRRIHDLSYPEGTGVNGGIHPERTKVVFSTLQDIMNIMKEDQCSVVAGIRENKAISISDEAREELEWWKNVLPTSPHIKILPSNRKTIEVFTSASGFKGMGGFYLKDKQDLKSLPVEQYFMKPHAESNVREKDPFPREMLAVEEALTMWSSVFRGFRVVFNTSNQGVAFGLLNHAVHSNGPPLDTLKRILLLGQKHDVDIWSHWIPNDDNELAICLSRFDRPRIHALAPKLSGLGGSRATRSDSRFSPSESKFSPSESKFSSPESKFSPSESRFSPSESKFSSSESKFSPSESKPSPSEGRFSHSKSRFPPSESRFSPSESGYSASESRFAPSEDRPTPPEGTKQIGNKPSGYRQRQTPASRNSSYAPPKTDPPLSPPPSPPPPPYKRTPSPPPATKPRAQRRKPRKAVLASESEAGEGSDALEQKKDGGLKSRTIILEFLSLLFWCAYVLCRWIGVALWKLVRLISGL
ncbi:hypothetical protein B9Z19DRAFT_1155236 [Tuber borchii]|uniref:Uncharacterized protein n=1 Tax=Tuber borchii TaxID=42251 RepID=A0A2T6ZHW0_TUBBO|nr:hypothetical protein B9Z19DRAFT_1155236 [Tuber borchii]